MLTVYVVLTLLGIGLTARLATWRSRHALTAGVGTLLAAVAILGGFSIGPLAASAALVVLALAVLPHLERGAHSGTTA